MVILKFSMNRYPYRDRNRYRTGILGEILFRKVPVCFTYDIRPGGLRVLRPRFL